MVSNSRRFKHSAGKHALLFPNDFKDVKIEKTEEKSNPGSGNSNYYLKKEMKQRNHT